MPDFAAHPAEAEQRKINIRRLARARRNATHSAFKDVASVAVLERGLDYLRPSLTQGSAPICVAGYYPIGSELDALPLLMALAEQGAEVALPCVMGADLPLQFRQWRFGDALQAGPFRGISQPLPTARLRVPDILLLPLLAFDVHGGRLGYGSGFYDRTVMHLERERPQEQAGLRRIGLAYACQEFPRLPQEAHDVRLEAVITEQGVRLCTC